VIEKEKRKEMRRRSMCILHPNMEEEEGRRMEVDD
jgi:hypothetical protein